MMMPAGLLLAPGAGAGSDQPGLVAVDDAVSAHGVPVRRIDFPYRLAGRRAPDRPAVLLATVRTAIGAFAEEIGVATTRLAAGGRSMGGRIVSMAAADEVALAALVLISYPLHPPGRPQVMRTEHFAAIAVPCLFVSGSRDAFASPDELAAAVALIDSPVTVHTVAGGDHGLRRHDAEVAAVVATWLAAL